MAAAVLVKKEPQHSMATSDDDGDFEQDDELDLLEDRADLAAKEQLRNGMLDQSEEEEEEAEDSSSEEEEDIELDDAENEEDDEVESIPNNDDTEPEDEDDDDEDGEGVGAVKIQPGVKEQEDEDAEATISEDEEGSVASAGEQDDNGSNASGDTEVDAVWEAVAAAGEDEEPANPNRCIFCHQNEENDPSEDFELYLACGVCGDNAHRQCAREAEAFKTVNESENWYCPGCVANNLVPEPATEVEEEAPETINGRISRDRIAGDLLPPQRGGIKPGSHSVFNQLITPDDPMDGSRLLRKRKTSPTETDDTSSQKKKTRDKDHNTNHTNMNASVDVPAEELDVQDAPGLPHLTNGELKKADTPSASRALRTLRIKSNAVSQDPVAIIERSKTSIKIVFRVDPESLKKVLSRPPKPSWKGQRKKIAPPPISQPAVYTPSFGQPLYSLHGRENDESKSKPYGGILKTEEADTTITLPKNNYRHQFDDGRQKAEEEWKVQVTLAAEAAAAQGLKKAKKVSGPASQIEYIEFGQHQIDTWYAAPYPEEYSRNKAVFICEFCLKYMESDIVAWRHKTKCPWKHPPGDEIYRDGKIMMFEVDGRKNQFYCQNLCLLAKLFLGSKTLYYDVEPFLFYVMTEYDEYGCHFVGYFSKEKRPSSQNNVSCILVLPIHQRKGYGHLLMEFSYLLTRVEKKTGSPEKPLSDMGLVSYRNYWRLILSYYLRDIKPGDPVPSIRKMSNDTGLTPDDVISALDALGSLIREPASGTYAFKLKTDIYNTVIDHHEVKNYPALNPKALIWTPYIVGRGGLSIYEHAPPLNTVAPREDDEVQSVEMSNNSIAGSKSDLNPTIETNGMIHAGPDSFVTLSNGNDNQFHSVTQVKEDVDEGSSSGKVNGISKPASYYEAARSIPATQFVIFPPPRGSARGRGTPRPLLSRSTPSSRASAGRSRAPARTNSARRSTARPKSGTRKTGGTGRGPGRWPKGTKKSDFDGADSAPGMPPKMDKQRSRLNNEVLLGDEADENDIAVEMEEDEDEDENGIVYDTPAPSRRRDRNKNTGKAISASGGSRRGKPKALDGDFVITGEIDEDEEMEDGPVLADEMDVDL